MARNYDDLESARASMMHKWRRRFRGAHRQSLADSPQAIIRLRQIRFTPLSISTRSLVRLPGRLPFPAGCIRHTATAPEPCWSKLDAPAAAPHVAGSVAACAAAFRVGGLRSSSDIRARCQQDSKLPMLHHASVPITDLGDATGLGSDGMQRARVFASKSAWRVPPTEK